MEEFGYFRDIEEMLPEDFTAVFEIARVIEDENSRLFQTLAPVMTVSQNVQSAREMNSREWRPNRQVPHGEEYEAALMGNFSDIRRIFPQQFLLPEEIFMRRYAQRSLWINVPRTPVTLPYKSSSTDYAPDNYKQKVYLLLDTSTSMSSHHRFQMAKAVVYLFLKRNLKELGHVYMRTFDTELGAMQRATDTSSLRRLIRYAMRLGRLGNGTAMERAILQAAEDIRAHSGLSGAEILMVTDGACHLDEEKIRSALGETIRLNTIKIGNAEIFADEKMLNDLATQGSSPRQRELTRLEEELRRTKHDLASTAREAEKQSLRSHVETLGRRAGELRGTIVGQLQKSYGREIESLSKVFVQIDDISADAVFTLQQSEIDEIREIMSEVETDFSEGIDADSLREAALLFEHVQMLLKSAGDTAQKEQLQQIADRLTELLRDLLQSAPTHESFTGSLSRSDLHDLHMMLGKSSGAGASLVELLLAMVRRTWKKMFAKRV
jgi:hypothetical protein